MAARSKWRASFARTPSASLRPPTRGLCGFSESVKKKVFECPLNSAARQTHAQNGSPRPSPRNATRHILPGSTLRMKVTGGHSRLVRVCFPARRASCDRPPAVAGRDQRFPRRPAPPPRRIVGTAAAGGAENDCTSRSHSPPVKNSVSSSTSGARPPRGRNPPCESCGDTSGDTNADWQGRNGMVIAVSYPNSAFTGFPSPSCVA